METLKAKEKFVFNLMQPDDRPGKITLLYIVYKTIETNTGITINQLKWLLDTEYMLQNDVVSGTVAALTSKTLFNCVSRWQPPKSSQQRSDAVHLRVRKDSREFDKWYENSLTEFPELLVFIPPVFSGRQTAAVSTIEPIQVAVSSVPTAGTGLEVRRRQPYSQV
jgi:hypothetical protein